jgi:hypothetical protein
MDSVIVPTLYVSVFENGSCQALVCVALIHFLLATLAMLSSYTHNSFVPGGGQGKSSKPLDLELFLPSKIAKLVWPLD